MPDSPNKLSQFWSELKRRNVIRVITVYIAVSLAILELVSNISEPFGLPDWTLKLVFVILIVGFIIIIIVSWIYDIHPEGGMVKTEPADKIKPEEASGSSKGWKIASFISFVVIIGLIALNIFGEKKGSRIDESLAKSIAVLPFLNFSVDSGQEPMCLGLTDEIINHLFKIESFDKVSSLNSVMTYIGSEKKTPEIADELAVNYILEGTYKKIGDQIRVTAQLIEARTDTHLWQHEYDRPYEEIIAIQADIALQIADHIRVFISGSEKQRIQKVPTTNPKAYETLKKAMYLIFTEGFIAIPQALEIVLEVIKADPEYADAYATFGHFTLWLGTFAGQTEIQYATIDAIQYFDKALELDQNNAMAHVGKGNIHEWARWDYVEAQKEYLIAFELEPNNPLVYVWAAEFYLKMVQLDNLWEIIDKAPDAAMQESYAKGQVLAGNKQEAHNSFIFTSNDVLNYRWIGESCLWLGEYDSAKFYLEYAMKNKHPDMSSPRFQAYLSLAYEKANHLQQAQTIINRLIAKSDTTSVGSPEYFTGWYYSGIGNKDSAFYWLEKAYEHRSPEMPWLKVDPIFKFLKDDPRYWDLYERTGHKAYDDYMASRKE